MSVLDHENFRFMESLVNSPDAKQQQAESPDLGGIKTAYGTIQGGDEDLGEGFAVARRPRPLDKAPESVRQSAKMIRAMAPSAAIAAMGGLAGGLPSGGIGVPAGIAGALGAKAIYDIGSPVINALLGSDTLPSSNIFADKALDYLGVPYPETPGEQSLFNIGRAAIDAMGGGFGIGRTLAKGLTAEQVAARGAAATTPEMIGGAMQYGGPLMDAAQGASGQSLIELVDPEGSHPIADVFLGLLGGAVPPVARATPSFLAGTREMTPAHQDAMRTAMTARGASAPNPEIARTPQQIENFIRDAEASGSVSAGLRAAFQGRNPFEAMANRVAVSNVERNLLEGALNPKQAIQNIDDSIAMGLNENIPGFNLGSVAAANDEGVAQALSPALSNPRVVQRGNLNQGALSQFSSDIAAPVNEAPGAFNSAAAARESAFVGPAGRTLADTDASIALQEQMIRDLELRRAVAEAELADVQRRLSENAPATQRQAASEAGSSEYWKKYKDLQKKMEAGKDPAELSKPISVDPIASGVAQSRDVSATALQPTNPIVENIEQQLARFGVEPGAAPDGPTMTKTVIAAQPSGPEGAAVPTPVSAMTPARAAQIEAGIAAMPEPKGPVKYLGGSTPVESEVRTPGGQVIKVRRKIVELEDVVRSGNEAHPVEYQNRDRAEIASKNQINDIFGKFDPRQITGSQPSATTGAPIVGPSKNILEGGHGRISVLERVLTDPSSAAKRAAYIDELTRSGHDVSGFKNPVEVQERVTPLTPPEVEAYVADMNRPVVAQLSTGDMARADSKKILSGAVALLDPTKPLDHPANADFVRQLNSGLGATELNSYIRADGGANSTLVRRYQNGLNQAAYGERTPVQGQLSSADSVLRAMRDDSDPMIKGIASAMDDASGLFAKLRMMTESGQLDAKYDLGQKVAEAASFVREAKRNGVHPLEMLNQAELPAFGGPDDTVRSLVELFYNEGSQRQVGTRALAEALEGMASDAAKQVPDIFKPPVPVEKLIQDAKQFINARKQPTAGAAQEAPAAQATPQAPVAAPEVPQASVETVGAKRKGRAKEKTEPSAESEAVRDLDRQIKKIAKERLRIAEKSTKPISESDQAAFDKKTEELNALQTQRDKLADQAKKAGVLPATGEPQAMLKDTGTTEPAPAAPETPPPTPVEAVSVMSAPAEVLTVENAAAVLDDLNAKMRAASRAGGVEYTNTKNELQPIIDELTLQLESEAPNLMKAKQLYAVAAPDLIHGVTSKIRKAGPGGSPSAVQPSKTLELWFKGEPSKENAAQLAAIMGDTPENVDAIRQFSISSVAAATKEQATGPAIRNWLAKKAQIFERPEFASIGEEIRRYANQIDNASTQINQAGRDIEAARRDLIGLGKSRTEAESALSFARKTASEAGSAKIASGDAGIRQVLSDPLAAREAVSAADTPQARADLDNKVRDYIDRSMKNTAVNADRPVASPAVEAEDLNVSMAKSIRELTDAKTPEGKSRREALEILTSPEHIRRLDMLANALESEAKQTKLTRGGSPMGSDTTQKTATQRAAQAASPFYRRMTLTILNALSDTNTARQFLADVHLNPPLLKEILRMHKEADVAGLNGIVRAFAKRTGRVAGYLGQRNSDWRKRQQEAEDMEDEGVDQTPQTE